MTDVGRTSGAALMQPALQLSPMQDTRVDLRSERHSSRSDVRFMRVGGKVGAGGGEVGSLLQVTTAAVLSVLNRTIKGRGENQASGLSDHTRT
jgi:hypothetical protein